MGWPQSELRHCSEWDVWSAVSAHSSELEDRIAAAFQIAPGEDLLRLLASAGRLDPVVRSLDDGRLARTAVRLLAEALQRNPEQETVRKALRRALSFDDAELRKQARQALLAVDDPVEGWGRVLAVLREGEDGPRLRVLEELDDLNLPIPEAVIRELVARAREDPLSRARIMALAVLGSAAGAAARMAPFELELLATLRDPDEEVRRAAAYYFVRVPARRPETVSELLQRLEDRNPYVRDNAAMALGQAGVFPAELLARLKARLEQGDPDDNVAGKLEEAYLHALRVSPDGVPDLLDIVLHRKGPARWRKALAEGRPAASPVAHTLLNRLAKMPLKVWAPLPEGHFSLSDLLAAEREPLSWSVLSGLIPPELLNPWLVEQALAQTEASMNERLYLSYLASTSAVAASKGAREGLGYAGERLKLVFVITSPQGYRSGPFTVEIR